MSTMNKHLPRYYKGYDMDVLLTKMYSNQLTEEEGHIIDEAQAIYFKKYSEETQKMWDEWEKSHSDEIYMKTVDRHFIIDRTNK